MVTAIWHGSPNCGRRRDGLKPSLIVLHYTAMASADAALQRLCDATAEVSAHYLIGGDGRLWQMVAEDRRAWHAGTGEWHGHDDINSRSIGIELDNRGDHPFSNAQICTLEQLLADIMTRWTIPASGVIGHSDMAPGRKCDPGARFDWPRLARQGLADGVHGLPAPDRLPDLARFRQLANTAGFTAPVSDALLLDAVRLRYRPWGHGPLDCQDMAIFSDS
ncbi:MAG: N-acetylmuramoyl-L-alanine amidase [Rhodobacteraceae bacterium]|nr:N-acetylmuramoyl-L-alanine amidase [Paracoccaceae bacterium]